MGLEDQFAHTLILAGAFLYAGCLIADIKEPFLRVAGFLAGAVMVVVGLADRIADHL